MVWSICGVLCQQSAQAILGMGDLQDRSCQSCGAAHPGVNLTQQLQTSRAKIISNVRRTCIIHWLQLPHCSSSKKASLISPEYLQPLKMAFWLIVEREGQSCLTFLAGSHCSATWDGLYITSHSKQESRVLGIQLLKLCKKFPKEIWWCFMFRSDL